MSDSAFFTSDPQSEHICPSAPELIHESQNGWSEVYRVDRDGRFRVLKALKEQYRGDVQYETLLRKEYEIGYGISHPNICEVYGFHNVPGIGNCIEMEWVNGVSLDVLLSGHKISRDQSAKIIKGLCDAVAYCHSCQVIHRDIKPENIMITHNGHNVKLIDFGLSDSDSHSVFKSACGTLDYAAPELLCGGQPNIHSDIYSIGKIISLLHPSFSSIAAKCTKEDPEKRYSDAESVRSAAVSKAGRHRYGLVAVLACLGIAAAVWSILVNNYDEEAPISELAVPEPEPVIFAEPEVVLPEPAAVGNESSSLNKCDTTAIDELFKMATELLESGQ